MKLTKEQKQEIRDQQNQENMVFNGGLFHMKTIKKNGCTVEVAMVVSTY